MMNTPGPFALGRAPDYPDRYDAGLLFPIARAAQREALGLGAVLPFGGADFWTAYEISWLDAQASRSLRSASFACLLIRLRSSNRNRSSCTRLYARNRCRIGHGGTRSLT
jgi:NADPH-dependent 7-cyano-7-deazaguanine reductase QueF-like protein